MKTKQSVTNSIMAAMGLLSTLLPVSQSAYAQGDTGKDFVPPVVFQAAGANADSILGAVNAFRAALGGVNNLNNPGPIMTGRREINWDGGNPAIVATTPPVNPFDVFLNTRGSRFTTPATGPNTGLSQATPAGLAVLFNNPTYVNIFTTFSPSRLFTPVGSNITDGFFFVPGTAGATAAAVRGFGAVFTDVDQPDGSGPGKKLDRKASTLIEFFDRNGKLLSSSTIAPSAGDASLSFFGALFSDARIAQVRIITDNAPGPNDDAKHDIVMMDDFIYGEPQALH
ncbi:MAG TPA: hypothetical protein VGG94_02780 [Chthoniobacterales bacterium]